MISQAYPLAKQQRCLIHISRNLAAGCSKHSFEVVDKTDEVSSKHSFEVADKTDEVSYLYLR